MSTMTDTEAKSPGVVGAPATSTLQKTGTGEQAHYQPPAPVLQGLSRAKQARVTRQRRKEWERRIRSSDPEQRGAGRMWCPPEPPDPEVTEERFDAIMLNQSWAFGECAERYNAKLAKIIDDPAAAARRLRGKMPEWDIWQAWDPERGPTNLRCTIYYTDARPNAARKAFLNLAAFYGATVVELHVPCNLGGDKAVERIWMFDLLLASQIRGEVRPRVRRHVLRLVPGLLPGEDRRPKRIEAQVPAFLPFVMPKDRPNLYWRVPKPLPPMEEAEEPIRDRQRGKRKSH